MDISIHQFVSALIVLSCLFAHAPVHAENSRDHNELSRNMDDLVDPEQPIDPQEDVYAVAFICNASYSPLEGKIEFLTKPYPEYPCSGELELIKHFYICSTLESSDCDNYTEANLYPEHMMGHMLETLVQASLKNQLVYVDALEGVIVTFTDHIEP